MIQLFNKLKIGLLPLDIPIPDDLVDTTSMLLPILLISVGAVCVIVAAILIIRKLRKK